jgi:hypothetical protein
MSDELLDLHRELQAALSRYGVTRYTMDLQFRLERLLAKEQGVNLADAKQLDAALDVPHRRAFGREEPTAATDAVRAGA